ncbi:MAG: alpha/beta hydrolase [Acidobacteriota bacterium]
MIATLSKAPNYSTNVRIHTGRQWAARFLFRAMWRIAPAWTRRRVEERFFIPRAYNANATERQWLDRAQTFQLEVHEAQIHAWQWGRGPAVMLLHGWNGRGIQLHSFIAPLLDARCTVVAVDGPAHGASRGKSASYFEFTDAVSALLTGHPGRPFCGVVAHSFGAAAVVNSLAHLQLPIPAVLLAPSLRLRALLDHTFAQYGLPEAIYQPIITTYEERFGYSFREDDPHLRLKDLCAPALVIHDRDDPTVAYEDSRTLCSEHAHLSLHTTRGLGHRSILGDPGVVATSVAFIERSARPRAPGAGSGLAEVRQTVHT